MGGNLYDNAGITTTGFIGTYAGQPIDEFRNTSQQLQETYNANLADATKMDILNAERRALAGDDPLNQEISAEYQKKLDAIVEAGDYENMSTRVNALAREYSRDKRIQTLTDSKANADKYESEIADMKAKGITPVLTKDPSKHQSVTIGEDGKPVYNVFKAIPEARLGYDERIQDIWKDMQADAYSYLPEDEAKALEGYITTKQWSGISPEKIARLEGIAMKRYEQTPEFDQQMRVLKAKGMEEEKAKDLIFENLRGVGKMKEFNKIQDKYLQDKEWQDPNAKPKGPIRGGGIYSGQATINPYRAKDIKFTQDSKPVVSYGYFTDAKGNRIETDAKTDDLKTTTPLSVAMHKLGIKSVPGQTEEQTLLDWYENGEMTPDQLKVYGTKDEMLRSRADIQLNPDPKATEKGIKVNSSLQSIVQSINNNPGLLGLPEDQYDQWNSLTQQEKEVKASKIYEEMYNNIGQTTLDYVDDNFEPVSYTDEEVTSIIRPGQSIFIKGLGKDGGSYANIGGFSQAQKDIRKKLGYDEDDKLEFIVNDYGQTYGNHADSPGARIVGITVKNRDTGAIDTFESYIEAPKQQQAKFRLPLEIHKQINSAYLGHQGIMDVGNGMQLEVVNEIGIQSDGNYQPQGTVVINDKLKEYLEIQEHTQMSFIDEIEMAKGIKVPQGTLAKWILGARIPRKKDMLLLYEVTEGKVQPNDFYDVT